MKKYAAFRFPNAFEYKPKTRESPPVGAVGTVSFISKLPCINTLSVLILAVCNLIFPSKTFASPLNLLNSVVSNPERYGS